jgi:hypothetical protein
MKRRSLVSSVVVVFLIFSCGKSVNVGQNDSPPLVFPPPGTVNSPVDTGTRLTCDSQDRVHWSFKQPQPELRKSIDLLFVADTSRSMSAKRARVASAVSSFVNALPSGTDYRIGVMLAHGARSSFGGALYSASGSREVLDSSQQMPSEIQAELRNSLVNVPNDPDDANGEAMMASFQRSLTASRFARIQSQGLYRDNAALAVIFISDENDVCYPPQDHGYLSFPDYVAAPTSIERKAYSENCLDSTGKLAISPESTLGALARLKPSGDFSVAGIMHVDPAKVPNASGSEESMGHGIIELVNLARQSYPDHEIALDITSEDFSAGLSSFGALTSSQLSLRTVFALDSVVDPDSIIVTVDQKRAPFSYESQSGVVRLDASDAGGAGSLITVDACRAK